MQIAVPEDAAEGVVSDELSALLSENGVYDEKSSIADWRYVLKPQSPVVSADAEPEEGEIFTTLDSKKGLALLPGDNPELDGTDAAHPAWWRGSDHGLLVCCQKINEILDGDKPVSPLDVVDGRADPKTAYHELRKRVKKLARTLNALATIASYLNECAALEE